MNFLKDMFSLWYDVSFSFSGRDFFEYIILIIIWILNIIFLAIIYHFLIHPVLYTHKLSEVKEDMVEIVNKDAYTTHSTTYIQSGNVMVPIISTIHHYDLQLKGDVIDETIDNEDYYSKFKVGQRVKVFYKERYEKFRFSTESNWKFIKNEIKEIVE